MVIFRHHCGSLNESMKTVQEFKSFEELQSYVVEYMKPYMKLLPSDVVAEERSNKDDRIGWKDSTYLCISGYNDV